jgi:DNA-directed RNA polymerase subunit alpha
MDKSIYDQKIRPEIKVEEYNKESHYAKFVCQPLERGFGITLGNMLRRVMLSSMTGAAITSIKIDGVTQEFTTIDNVTEDVTDIILNLKKVRLKLEGNDPAQVRIEAKGPMVVTAANIETTHRVEVLNKNHYIATLAPEGRLSMSLTVQKGKSYAHAEKPNSAEDQDQETIPVDAMFSPVVKVNFTVTNATFGQRTDYDRLTLEVWTDGRIAPVEAVVKAARLLNDELYIFSNISSKSPSQGTVPSQTLLTENGDYLSQQVDELELSVRASNCLKNAGIFTIWQLVEKSEQELLKTKNFGRKSLLEIKDVLVKAGFSLGMNMEEFKKSLPQLEED